MPEDNKENIFSAADTSIGFDYQFYYFLYLLLGIKFGEKIGLELKEDVHVDFDNGKTLLIQTKHSIQTNAKGDIINLTERDKDLWKTLNNWTKTIQSQSDSTSYLNITSFQLVTNKNNLSNPFIVSVIKVQNKLITIADFKLYVETLIASTADEVIKAYMVEFKKIPNKTLRLFIEKIQFELNEDNLIEKIKRRLLEKIHIEERIDDVFNALHSEIRNNNYLAVKAGKAIELSFEDFNAKFRNCFKIGLSKKLPLRHFALKIPENLNSQLFIRQLVEIKDIKINDTETILEYTSQMLRLYNNLKEWETKGELLESELRSFDKNSVLMWKNSFKSQFRGIASLIDLGYPTDKITNCNPS